MTTPRRPAQAGRLSHFPAGPSGTPGPRAILRHGAARGRRRTPSRGPAPQSASMASAAARRQRRARSRAAWRPAARPLPPRPRTTAPGRRLRSGRDRAPRRGPPAAPAPPAGFLRRLRCGDGGAGCCSARTHAFPCYP